MSSPNISFDSIPTGLRKPGQYIEFNTRLAVHSLPANVQKVLIIGQKLADAAAWPSTTAITVGRLAKPGTANGRIYFCVTAGTTGNSEPTWPTTQGGEVTDGTAVWKEFATDSVLATKLAVKQLFSDADAKEYFGNGSMIHRMAKAAIAANPYLQLFAIADDDGAGVFASGTVTISGAPTGSGAVRLWIGDQHVDVAFSSTDTATSIATALKAAIAARPDLPVVSKSAAGVLTVIYKHAGTLGNQLKMVTSFTPSGNLAIALVQLANGATDPDIHATGGILDKILPETFHIIINPYNDATSLGYLKTHLDTVSGALEQRPAIAVIGSVAAIATSQTLADACNHGRMLIASVKACKTPAMEIAAGVASAIAFTSDPASNLDGTIVSNVVAPDIGDRFTRTEIETLLLQGVTPLEVVSERVCIARAISTFQTDESFLDISTIRTLDYVREAIRNRVRSQFGSSKLTVRVRSAVRSEVLVVLKQLEDLEIVEYVDDNKAGVIAEIDSTDVTRLNVKIPVDVVNGLHVFAGRIDLIL
jgi:phage tail sheath gpL-like